MRKKILSLLVAIAIGISLLNVISSDSASAADSRIITCTSLKSGVIYLAKTGKCNARIYESSIWYKEGTAPSGTPGSKIISLTICRSKSKPESIILRIKCNARTQIATIWQRPLGPPAAPSIVTITAGVLGTATVETKAPTENGGARITSLTLSANPTSVVGKTARASSTYSPNSSGVIEISGLTPGASYVFTLIANNAVGASAPSQASASFLAPTVPGPATLSAVATTGTNSALITYAAPSFDGGSPITSYTATSSPGGIQATVYRSTTGTIEISGLAPSTTYTFTITANNFAGSSIPSTVSAAITTLTPPPPVVVEPTPTLAVPTFTLSSSSETRTVNTAATGFTINSTGGTIASFAINATPAGMSFNTSTGELTGTPNTVASATAYTVTATNASGSATAIFTLTVAAAPLATPAFTLTHTSETVIVDTAATGFTINSTGGAIASFAINATPAGMSFNTSTGELTGTPNTVASATAYTVTATNASGTASRTFVLTVSAALSTDATLSTTSTIKGQTLLVLGTPSATLASATGGSVTLSSVQAGNRSNTGSYITAFTKTNSGATVDRIVKYLAGATYTTFATDTAYDGFAAISAGNFFIVKVTAADGATILYYKITVKLTPTFSAWANLSKPAAGGDFDLKSPTVTGAVAGNFDYSSASTGVITISSSTAHIVAAGTSVITATFTPTNTAAYSSATTTMTITVSPGDYVVGMDGPGGGKVFYVSTSTFACGPTLAATCKFLEVAPNTWSGGAADPSKIWAVDAKQSLGVDGITSDVTVNNTTTGIGLGYQNSIAIVNQGNDTTTAAGAARAYSGGSQSDWYLPTSAELNQLCKWVRGVAWVSDATVCTGGTINTGPGASGFASNFYWSSSEFVPINPTIDDPIRPWGQWFNDHAGGIQANYDIALSEYVRPVRAF